MDCPYYLCGGYCMNNALKECLGRACSMFHDLTDTPTVEEPEEEEEEELQWWQK